LTKWSCTTYFTLVMMKRKKIAMKSVCLETSDDNMDKEVDDNFM
jgi:hypothetical protein